MQETIKLDGNRYIGIFKGEKKAKSGSYSCCEYERDYTNTWYEGTGVIEIRKFDKRNFVFNFSASANESYTNNLRGAVFCFKKDYHSRIRPPYIVKEVEVADLFLERILNNVKKMRSEANPIPTISIEPMEISDLIEAGFVSQDDGQIRLPFGI